MDAVVWKCTYKDEGIVVKVTENGSPYYLMLKRSHPNYVDLYKKIKVGYSYTFEISISWCSSEIDAIIVDIKTPNTYAIDCVVTDLINLSAEGLPSMMELVTDKKDIRLIACESYRDKISIGKKYTVKYLESYQENMGAVISLQ